MLKTWPVGGKDHLGCESMVMEHTQTVFPEEHTMLDGDWDTVIDWELVLFSPQ